MMNQQCYMRAMLLTLILSCILPHGRALTTSPEPASQVSMERNLCVAARNEDVAGLKAAASPLVDPLLECPEFDSTLFGIALRAEPAFWQEFVALTDASWHARLNGVRLNSSIQSISLGMGDDGARAYYQEVLRLLKEGILPEEKRQFSWETVATLLGKFISNQSLDTATPSPERRELAIAIVQHLLPRLPVDLALSTEYAARIFWEGMVSMPEPQAVSALELMHKKFGSRVAKSAQHVPGSFALQYAVKGRLLLALTEAGLLSPTMPSIWIMAAQYDRVDVLRSLSNSGTVPAGVLAASVASHRSNRSFAAFDFLLDHMITPPLQPELNQALASILDLTADESKVGKKWPRIERLLSLGADINQVFSSAEVYFSNRLVFLLRQDPQLAMRLLERGLSGDVPMQESKMNLLLTYLSLVSPLYGGTPPYDAQVLRMLAKNTRDINVASTRMQTFPLYQAIRRSAELGRAMLEAGAQVDAIEPQGTTMLMRAAALNDADIVQFLLAERADAALLSRQRINALAYAQCYGSKDAELLLLAKGIAAEGTQRCLDERAACAATGKCKGKG